MQCDIEHDNNYKIISYKEIMPNVENIKSEIKELRNIIDRFERIFSMYYLTHLHFFQ